jgi:hypothetical protein
MLKVSDNPSEHLDALLPQIHELTFLLFLLLHPRCNFCVQNTTPRRAKIPASFVSDTSGSGKVNNLFSFELNKTNNFCSASSSSETFAMSSRKSASCFNSQIVTLSPECAFECLTKKKATRIHVGRSSSHLAFVFVRSLSRGERKSPPAC